MRVKLSDVTKYLKGTQINGDDLIENGEYIYLNGGINPSGRWNAANVKGNTVTISEGGNSSGYVNYVTEPFWCGAHCYYLFDGPKNTKYLYYALKSQQERLFDIRSGACMPNIKKSDLGKFEFEFDTDEQKQSKIVSVLSKIEVVIGERKRELELLDDLIRARFVELFGDVENNPFSWEKTKIGAVIQSCEAGWSGNGAQREKRDGEVAVLKVSAVTKGYFIPEECKVLDDQRNIKKYIFPEKGDLLFSRANTREMVGATAIVTQDYPEHILPDKLWKIRFTDVADAYYMKYVLSSNSIRSMFSAVSTGTSGSMYNVSMEKFKSITIPLPPRELQNQFASFVEATAKSKVAVQKALDETQLLFDSLMQKYFG